MIKPNKNIAWVINNLSPSQLSYTIIYSTNLFLNKHPDYSVSVFQTSATFPCLQPNFARYNLTDIGYFNGHVFTTSVDLLLKTYYQTESQVYYYIWDLEWLRPNNKFKECLKLPNVKKIFRSTDHRDKFLKDFDYNNNDLFVMKDPNYDFILKEIINATR